MTVEEYISQLTPEEKIAYDVSKSNGYLKKKNIPLL